MGWDLWRRTDQKRTRLRSHCGRPYKRSHRGALCRALADTLSIFSPCVADGDHTGSYQCFYFFLCDWCACRRRCTGKCHTRSMFLYPPAFRVLCRCWCAESCIWSGRMQCLVREFWHSVTLGITISSQRINPSCAFWPICGVDMFSHAAEPSGPPTCSALESTPTRDLMDFFQMSGLDKRTTATGWIQQARKPHDNGEDA